MHVFRTYFLVLRPHLPVVAVYLAVLVGFSLIFMSQANVQSGYSASKPAVTVVSEDVESAAVDGLHEFLGLNAELVELSTEANGEANGDATPDTATPDTATMKDALFFEQVDAVFVVPEGFHAALLAGDSPTIEAMTYGSEASALSSQLVNTYLRHLSFHLEVGLDEQAAVYATLADLAETVTVEMQEAEAEGLVSSVRYYMNFLGYTIVAIVIQAIAAGAAGFNRPPIHKRNAVSALHRGQIYAQINAGHVVVALATLAVALLLGAILAPGIVGTSEGALFALNALAFTLAALGLAVLVGDQVRSPAAVGAAANVVSLGSAFLGGAFVPQQFLADEVLAVAHVLPTYWFVANNDQLADAASLGPETLSDVFLRMGVLVAFAVGFVVLNYLLTQRRRAQLP